MLTLCKSTVLGAAFLAGVAIAGCADDPLYRAGAGSSQQPGRQLAALPPATAPPPSDRATLEENPSGPAPQQPSIGHDGPYAGSMTELGSGLGGHATTACVNRTPVNMRIDRDNVTISYSDWNRRAIQYRGKIDPAGRINAQDTNDVGSASVLAGQIRDNGFTGHVERNYCHYTLTMSAEAASAAAPARSATPDRAL
jgi:hypothetical protein